MNENKSNIDTTGDNIKAWCLEMTRPSKKLVALISIAIILSIGFNILLTVTLVFACLIFSKKLQNRKDKSNSIPKLAIHLRAVGVLTFKFLCASTAILLFIVSIEHSTTVPKAMMHFGFYLQFLVIFIFLVLSLINLFRLGRNKSKPISKLSAAITSPIKFFFSCLILAWKAMKSIKE